MKNNSLRPVEITASNVSSETYFNQVQLCRITGYANAPAAIMATGEVWAVRRDDCGNIVSGVRR